jgi:hypothetical protein
MITKMGYAGSSRCPETRHELGPGEEADDLSQQVGWGYCPPQLGIAYAHAIHPCLFLQAAKL